MARFGVILLKAGITVLIALAWVTPSKLWQWMLAVWVLECGHWLAASALLTGVAGAMLFRSWLRWLSLALGALLALTLMIPAVLAARQDPQFSMKRLFTREPGPETKLLKLWNMERKVYFRNQSDTLDALIYRPADSAIKRPWVLMLHTGGWDSGESDEFSAWNRELAGRGYVVVAMNYHLAPRYKWPRQKEDVSRAVQWVRENANELGVDPAKLFLAGRSAGGQIAMTCALTDSELAVKGCISFYAPLDMEFSYRNGQENDILRSPRQLRNYLGGDPDTVPEAYKSSSAIYHISKDMPPVLLLHGTKDALVWVEHALKFKGRCEQMGLGAKCTVVQLPWATHGFDYFVDSPGGQLSMNATLKFLQEHSK